MEWLLSGLAELRHPGASNSGRLLPIQAPEGQGKEIVLWLIE